MKLTEGTRYYEPRCVICKLLLPDGDPRRIVNGWLLCRSWECFGIVNVEKP